MLSRTAVTETVFCPSSITPPRDDSRMLSRTAVTDEVVIANARCERRRVDEFQTIDVRIR